MMPQPHPNYGGYRNDYMPAAPQGPKNASRSVMLWVGWIMSVLWAGLALVVILLATGSDVFGVVFVLFILAPIFFFIQATLNISYLVLPKYGTDSYVNVWLGNLIWWVGTLLLAAMYKLPPMVDVDGNPIDYVGNGEVFAQFLTLSVIWLILAAVGLVWIIVALVLAVKDADRERMYAYRRQAFMQRGY